MKIGFNPGSIVDASGTPLQGRVLVYVHDSLEKKSIYTMEGSEYVASENPVLLDTTGRIPTTLFFDVGVVDVLVQKYVGAPGQLADESPDEDFEDFDRFEAGFDFDPEKEASRTVETIADLKDIENPSGVVRVNCYTTPGDTFPRYYLWNPNCTASEDGGCVIADTHDASGMWCYLCEGDSIKSSVYGIKPGTEETNLGAFCAAPLGVSGDYTITYPTTLYVEQGTYTGNPSLYVTNDRKIIFSCKSKFTQTIFYASSFDVDGRNSSYIADFYVPNSDRSKSVPVHSSWFRDAFYLWGGFGTIYLDKNNYFENNSFSSSVLVTDATIIGNDTHYQPTFTSDGHLFFDNCTFIGSKLFQHYGFKAIFEECNFSDKLFYSMNYNNVDFGLLSQGHSIQVDSWNITDAQNADVWLAWANAVGMSIVDLCGRSVKVLYNSNIQEFRNGVFLGGTVSTNVNVKFTDIGGSLTVYPMNGGKSLTLDHCNSVNIASDTPFSSILVRDSIVVVNNGVDNSVTSYSHDGGAVQATFKCAGWNASGGTHAKGKEISLRNVVLSIGNFSWFDNVTIRNCTIDNPIHVIPYAKGSDLLLECTFVGNTFGSNGYIAFGDSSVGNVDIYGVKVNNIVIKDNVFNTSGNGVMMPFMSNNGGYKYLASGQSATYKGNVGSCPLENFNERFSYDMAAMQNIYTEDPAGFSSYKCTSASYGIFNINPDDVYHHGDAIRLKSGAAYGYESYYLHDSAIANTNDQFAVRIACKITDYDATSTFKVFDE